MKGCERREQRNHDRIVAIGWHAENFRRTGKQFTDLDVYLKKLRPQTPQSIADEAAALFKGLEAQGKVRIRTVPRRQKQRDT